ncbi:MAG TPA: Fic family protein [Xanthobacteraceae bacterium]
MDSGTYESDDDGVLCFRPVVPRLPALEDVHDAVDHALRRLRDFDRLLGEWPRPGSIERLFARLDAVHSSGAEGSTTTFTDLMEFETSARVAKDLDDAEGVAACAAAFEAEGDSVGDLLAVTLRMHRRLFERARNRMISVEAGRWKSRRNATPDQEARGGHFFYTRPRSVPAAMEEWSGFTMAADPRVPEILRQALSHWMFEHIHPVADGNGRIGRLLVPLGLKIKGTLKHACAFFGEAVHEDKQLYVEALKIARISGDLTSWSRLFMALISRTAERNIGRINALHDLERKWRNATTSFRSDSMVHQLVRLALTRPAFTIQDALHDIGGTFASVNTAASYLVEAGILTVPSQAKRNRLFVAGEVLAIFDRFHADPPR